MILAALFSGGKDSTLAIHVAEDYGYQVKYLLTVKTSNSHSYMYHYPAIGLTSLQAKAMNKKLITASTSLQKEKELNAMRILFKKAKKEGVEGIVTGAIRSTYQAERVQKIAFREGLEVFNPLWLKTDEEIFDLLEKYDIRAIITRVAAYPLSADFLNKELIQVKHKLFRLKKDYGISTVGEGGEIETLAIQGKLFKQRLVIKEYEIEWKNYEGNLKIKKADLQPYTSSKEEEYNISK